MPAARTRCLTWLLLSVLVVSAPLRAEDPPPPLRQQTLAALKKAVAFYRGRVASHGGYVYYYSLDLEQRWGEGKATRDTIFVEPPGTPTVGLAYLEAHAATGDRAYLDAARETAEALVYGQLQSGGWAQVIHFGPAKRAGKYRNGKGGNWNASSLDDGQTQTALRFLAAADEALGFKHAAIHEAASYGFNALLAAQFPNGAFPQVWTGPVPKKPVVKARYPAHDWKTEGRVKNYWDYYTLNDGLAGDVADTLLAAHRVYKDAKYRAALERLGNFLLLAQMPEPQPGWCQQYNYDMEPIWARKFEPPAITGSESQDVLRTLLTLARVTGERKYLDPIPQALAYFNKSLLPDGRAARYYELRTNKSLFMDRQYRLTYDDSAPPDHYGWKVPARFDAIERAYQDVRRGTTAAPRPRTPRQLEPEVRRILAALDAEGRWVSTAGNGKLTGQPKFPAGFRFLSSAVFARNVHTLSAYLTATRP